jgi:hypothetical protein
MNNNIEGSSCSKDNMDSYNYNPSFSHFTLYHILKNENYKYKAYENENKFKPWSRQLGKGNNTKLHPN